MNEYFFSRNLVAPFHVSINIVKKIYGSWFRFLLSRFIILKFNSKETNVTLCFKKYHKCEWNYNDCTELKQHFLNFANFVTDS